MWSPLKLCHTLSQTPGPNFISLPCKSQREVSCKAASDALRLSEHAVSWELTTLSLIVSFRRSKVATLLHNPYTHRCSTSYCMLQLLSLPTLDPPCKSYLNLLHGESLNNRDAAAHQGLFSFQFAPKGCGLYCFQTGQ